MPLVTHRRAGTSGYQSVLVVRGTSRIHMLDGLRGASAAWVDPLSASGYVLPRIQLAALGIDPRDLFGEERFYGSHGAAVKAVLDGHADVAATFGGVDGAGAPGRGSWSDDGGSPGDLRVLATFGAIPSDLIAIRRDIAPDVRRALAAAFVDACIDPTTAPVARRFFGVDGFAPDGFASYDGLRRALDAAAARGLLELSSSSLMRNLSVRPAR
jgi:ABC-type phosphate/phosphonate transport system substrate-binding protein